MNRRQSPALPASHGLIEADDSRNGPCRRTASWGLFLDEARLIVARRLAIEISEYSETSIIGQLVIPVLRGGTQVGGIASRLHGVSRNGKEHKAKYPRHKTG